MSAPGLPPHLVCVESVRDYLTLADLRCTAAQLEDALDMPIENIRYRLRKAGTSWNVLKHKERIKRLDRLVLAGASQASMCTALGLSLCALQRVFRQEYGMSYKKWTAMRIEHDKRRAAGNSGGQPAGAQAH